MRAWLSLTCLLGVLGTSAAIAGTAFVIRASPTRIDIGSYRIRGASPTYVRALAAFGSSRTCKLGRGKEDAIVRWPALGVTAEFTTLRGLNAGGNACTRPREVFLDHLTITGGRWTTALGLHLGDPVSKLVRLYPRAVRHGSSYWLLTESNPAVGTRPLFSANTAKGRVISFLFIVQAEGE